MFLPIGSKKMKMAPFMFALTSFVILVITFSLSSRIEVLEQNLECTVRGELSYDD